MVDIRVLSGLSISMAFAKYIMAYTHHYSIIENIFTAGKMPWVPPVIPVPSALL